MAFVSSGYNPDKPMENRITDIGPRKFDEFYPPVIKKNKGNGCIMKFLNQAFWFMLRNQVTKFTLYESADAAL